MLTVDTTSHPCMTAMFEGRNSGSEVSHQFSEPPLQPSPEKQAAKWPAQEQGSEVMRQLALLLTDLQGADEVVDTQLESTQEALRDRDEVEWLKEKLASETTSGHSHSSHSNE